VRRYLAVPPRREFTRDGRRALCVPRPSVRDGRRRLSRVGRFSVDVDGTVNGFDEPVEVDSCTALVCSGIAAFQATLVPAPPPRELREMLVCLRLGPRDFPVAVRSCAWCTPPDLLEASRRRRSARVWWSIGSGTSSTRCANVVEERRP